MNTMSGEFVSPASKIASMMKNGTVENVGSRTTRSRTRTTRSRSGITVSEPVPKKKRKSTAHSVSTNDTSSSAQQPVGGVSRTSTLVDGNLRKTAGCTEVNNNRSCLNSEELHSPSSLTREIKGQKKGATKINSPNYNVGNTRYGRSSNSQKELRSKPLPRAKSKRENSSKEGKEEKADLEYTESQVNSTPTEGNMTANFYMPKSIPSTSTIEGGNSKAEIDVVNELKGRQKRRTVTKVSSYKECQRSDVEDSGDGDESSSDSTFHEPVVKKIAAKLKRASQHKSENAVDTIILESTLGVKTNAASKQQIKGKGRTQNKSKVKSEFELSKSKPRISKKEEKKLTIAVVKLKQTTEDKTKLVEQQDISSSDDDGADWEEVEDLDSHSLVPKDIKITVDIPGAKKQKSFSWFDYAKMLWRRYQREEHESVHKIELMCLLVHGRFINDVCNDSLLKAVTMSIYSKVNLKGKQCTVANVEAVISKLKEKVRLETLKQTSFEQSSINAITLLDSLVEGINSEVINRRDNFVLLMLGILRALGAAARLCMAWYPIPYRITQYQKQKSSKPKSGKSGNKNSAGGDNKQIKKSKGKGKAEPLTAGTDQVDEKFDRQIWLEVFVDQTWRAIDSSGTILTDLSDIEENLKKPVTYIESYDNAGKMKDLTAKYDSNWMTTTTKLRVEQEWWEEMITPYQVKESKKTKWEDEQIKAKHEQMPFPVTIGGFKDHQLYILERHLLKFQAIYPPTSIPLGYTKTKEAIYSRSCVHTLHSRETWLKDARQLKLGEEAYKYVKPRPKMKDIKSGIKITEATLPVFGYWQTEPFVPPVAENGKVPRNGYGNVEMFKPEMIPIGCVQIKDTPFLGRLARKLDIDCAEAMIGWDLRKGRTVPVMDGWVVCEEYKDTLMAAVEEYNATMAQREQEKREKRVYDNWKKIIKGLLIRERLRRKYGQDTF